MKNFRVPAGRWAAPLGGVALALALAGCSLSEPFGAVDYKSSTKLPPLETPPDLVSPRGDDRFTVPDRARGERTYSGYQTARATEKPPIEQQITPSVPGMRIERSGNERWLFVNQPPDKLWGQVREFWQESGFVIASESPTAGVMETDWAENRAKIPQDIIRRTLGRAIDQVYSTGERDKFRTRLEPAPGGTEVYITHRGMEEVGISYSGSTSLAQADTTRWQPRPPDPGLEAEFLRRLMIRLGTDQERAATQVAAAVPSAGDRARVVEAGGAQVLDVGESFDRAWRSIGLGLDRGGFTVEDRDRSQGVYYIRYIDPELQAAASGSPGLFARMFGLSRDQPRSSQAYRLKLTGSGERTQVVVLTREGQPLTTDNDRKTAEKILTLLRAQLV
jgi:outer membrane protein assembly factor BamC